MYPCTAAMAVEDARSAAVRAECVETYKDLLFEDRVADRNGDPYASTPLADVSPAKRGDILEKVVRQLDERTEVADGCLNLDRL